MAEATREDFETYQLEDARLLAMIKGGRWSDDGRTSKVLNSEPEKIGESAQGIESLFDKFTDPRMKNGARGNLKRYVGGFLTDHGRMPDDRVLSGISGAIENSLDRIGEANGVKGTISDQIPVLEMIVSMETAIRLNCFCANTTHVIHSKQKEAKFYKRKRKALTSRAGVKAGQDISMNLTGAYNQGVMNQSTAYNAEGEAHTAGVPTGELASIAFVGVGHKIKKNMEVWYDNQLIARDVEGNGKLSGTYNNSGESLPVTGSYSAENGSFTDLKVNGGAFKLPALPGGGGLRVKAESNWETGGEGILPRTTFEYEEFSIKPHWNAGSTVTSFMAAMDALTSFGQNLTSTGITELAMLFVASSNVQTITEQNFLARTAADSDLYLQPKSGFSYDPSTYERDAAMNYFNALSKQITINCGYRGIGDFIYVDQKCTDFLDRLSVHGDHIWRPRQTRLDANMKAQPHFYGRLGGVTGWDVYCIPKGSIVNPCKRLAGGGYAPILEDYEFIMGSKGNGTPYQSPIITGTFRTPLPLNIAMTNEFQKEDILVSEEYFHSRPDAGKWFIRGKMVDSAKP